MNLFRRGIKEARYRIRNVASQVLLRERPDVLYVVEDADWSVRWDGHYISRGVSARGIKCEIGQSQLFPSNGLVHFGCLNLSVKGATNAIRKGNRAIVTLFHGDFGINASLDNQLNQFLQLVPSLSRVVVANRIMFERLVSWGVPEWKLVLIPIGVDLAQFYPISPDKKRRLRDHYGIPNDAICIGSFQKDGEGWGEGANPKFIKGPDVFVEVVTQLSGYFPVHCVLTGPSRGYVKDALRARGIPFTHRFFKNYLEIADFYRCLDIYLVTSREEGGPKAVLEAPACGVPVVSTRVGMAPQVIYDNGLLADEVKELTDAASRILGDPALCRRFAEAAPASVREYDWETISGRYHALYQELLR